MELQLKDLPKIIAYLEKEVANPTYPKREALSWIVKDLKNDYVTYVFDEYVKENEESLAEGYEQSLEGTGRSTNNGENLDGLEEYYKEQFNNQLSTTSNKEKYELVLEAVELGTFSI